jgi:hypothetical protein
VSGDDRIGTQMSKYVSHGARVDGVIADSSVGGSRFRGDVVAGVEAKRVCTRERLKVRNALLLPRQGQGNKDIPANSQKPYPLGLLVSRSKTNLRESV